MDSVAFGDLSGHRVDVFMVYTMSLVATLIFFGGLACRLLIASPRTCVAIIVSPSFLVVNFIKFWIHNARRR